jgi:hypothetical protein
VVGSEIAANFYVQHAGQHGIVTNIGVAVERKVRGVECDVSFDESREPTIGGTDQRSQTTPEHAVMNEETVSVLLGRLADRRLAEIYGCGESGDVSGVADLQAIQRLRGVRDLVGDTEIVIEKTNQSV